MILEASNLTFSYSTSPVVEDVSLKVEAGERLAIIGPNGSGKSTLLKLLSGFLKPASGEIRLGNASLKELSELERGRTLGYLPQQVSTFFPFTAGEMVQMAMSVHSRGFFDGRGEKSRAVEALRRVNMGGLFDQPFSQMSGGGTEAHFDGTTPGSELRVHAPGRAHRLPGSGACANRPSVAQSRGEGR